MHTTHNQTRKRRKLSGLLFLLQVYQDFVVKYERVTLPRFKKLGHQLAAMQVNGNILQSCDAMQHSIPVLKQKAGTATPLYQLSLRTKFSDSRICPPPRHFRHHLEFPTQVQSRFEEPRKLMCDNDSTSTLTSSTWLRSIVLTSTSFKSRKSDRLTRYATERAPGEHRV